MQKLTCLILAVTFIFNSGCITTPSYEDKTLDLPKTASGLSSQMAGSAKVDSLIYLPSKLPLETFFSKLKKGEFTQALKKVDLNYKPTNANNEALTQLIEHDFIPVYVEFTNTGTKTMTLREGHFWLTDGEHRFQAINSTELPLRFKKINGPAITANVINTSVLVVGVAALLVAIAVVSSNGGNSGGLSGLFGGDPFVMNDMYLTTRVDYKNYLISKKELAPGETKKGILFFSVKDVSDLEDLKLNYQDLLAASIPGR